MKNLNKVSGNLLSKTWNSCLLFALTLLCSLSGNAQPNVFLPSAVPNRHFPKPIQPYAVPTAPFSPLFQPTFYGSRHGGSCYNSTFDFDGDSDDDNVNVWSICHADVNNYNNAVAYEVTDLTGTTLYRGCAYVGGDIANLQVGMYTPNGTAYHLVVAYWRAALPEEIVLDDYTMTTTGLLFNSSTVIGTLNNTTNLAQEISLDCHDNRKFVVAWEDVGYPISIKAYDYDPSPVMVPSPPSPEGPVNTFGSSSYRLPDVAMSHDGSSQYNVHVAAVDVSTFPATIVEYVIDFSTMGGAITPVMQDAYSAVTNFGPDWDDFQLKIDAPDHYSPGFPKWAYAFFSDDANKIKVRINNAGTYYNGTVNDGSMVPATTMIALPDLTIAGNAFPTISWTPGGNGMYVGWYTTYDHTLPVPTPPAPPNNPLYNYTMGSFGYVSVVIDDIGGMRSEEYNGVDYDNAIGNLNRIGSFIDPMNPNTQFHYPKIRFSKNNEGNMLFALFSSHNAQTNLIWPWPAAAFLGTYYEPPVSGVFPDYPNDNQFSNLGYADYDDLIIGDRSGSSFSHFYYLQNGTSHYLSQKYVSWYPAVSPLFRTTEQKAIVNQDKNGLLSISSNPFSNTNAFQLTGGNATIDYSAVLSSMDGKKIVSYKGSIAELNMRFKALQDLATGNYLLQVTDNAKKTSNFKLTKQ